MSNIGKIPHFSLFQKFIDFANFLTNYCINIIPNYSNICGIVLKRHSVTLAVNLSVHFALLPMTYKQNCQIHSHQCFHTKTLLQSLKMARKSQISIEKRSQINILRKVGKSIGEIAQIFGLSKNGVATTLKRHAETQSNVNRKRSGRPKKTSKSDDRHILMIFQENRFKTALEIRSEINKGLHNPFSTFKVQRRFFGRVAVKKPLLRPVNRQKRLLFAQNTKIGRIGSIEISFMVRRIKVKIDS